MDSLTRAIRWRTVEALALWCIFLLLPVFSFFRVGLVTIYAVYIGLLSAFVLAHVRRRTYLTAAKREE